MLGAKFCVDSSVLVAIFNDEAEGDLLQAELTQNSWVIGWPTIFETRIWLWRNRPTIVNDLFDGLLGQPLVGCVAFDEKLDPLAIDAFDRYGKGRHPAKLNFGDCMAYAVAKHHNVPLLFKGADFGHTDISIHPASVILP